MLTLAVFIASIIVAPCTLGVNLNRDKVTVSSGAMRYTVPVDADLRTIRCWRGKFGVYIRYRRVR